MATVIEWESGTVSDSGGQTQGAVEEWTQGGFTWAYLPGGTSAGERVLWDVSVQDQFTHRFYVVIPRSWPVSTTDIYRGSAGGVQGSIVSLPGVNEAGRLYFREAGSAQTATSERGLLAPGQIYRIEQQVDTVAGTVRGAVWHLNTDQPLFDTGVRSAQVDPPATRFAYGHFANTEILAPMAVGAVRVDDTVGSWLGRAPGDDGVPAQVTVVGVM